MDFSKLGAGQDTKKKAKEEGEILVVDFVNRKVLYRATISYLTPLPTAIAEDITVACALVGKIRLERIKKDEEKSGVNINKPKVS